LDRELAELARHAHPGLVLLETGEGKLNVERRLEAWLARGHARAVLSVGFAGGLSSSLRPGDLVIAEEVRDASASPDAKLLTAARRVRNGQAWIHFGLAVTSDEILWQAESKRALASSFADHRIGFVDMESTAIAGVCGRRGVPFLVARSITDLLDEDLPLDFNRYRDRDGRVDQRRVVMAALLRPWSFKGLLELRNRSGLCALRTADFVQQLATLID
jgi:adenosylhomocysteine nucleosidase